MARALESRAKKAAAARGVRCKPGAPGVAKWFQFALDEIELPQMCVLVKDVSELRTPIVRVAHSLCDTKATVCPCAECSCSVRIEGPTGDPGKDSEIGVVVMPPWDPAKLPQPHEPQVISHVEAGLSPMAVVRPGLPQLAAVSAPLVFADGVNPGGGVGASVSPYRIYEFQSLQQSLLDGREQRLQLAEARADQLVQAARDNLAGKLSRQPNAREQKAKKTPPTDDPAEVFEDLANRLVACAGQRAVKLATSALAPADNAMVRTAVLQSLHKAIRVPEEQRTATCDTADAFEVVGGWGRMFLRSLSFSASGGSFPEQVNALLDGDRLMSLSIAGSWYTGDDQLLTAEGRDCLHKQVEASRLEGARGLERALRDVACTQGPDVPWAFGWGVDAGVRRASDDDTRLRFDGFGGWHAIEARNAVVAGTVIGWAGWRRLDGGELSNEGFGGARLTVTSKLGALSAEALAGCWLGEGALGNAESTCSAGVQNGVQLSVPILLGLTASVGGMWRCAPTSSPWPCEGRGIGSVGWQLAPDVTRKIADAFDITTD